MFLRRFFPGRLHAGILLTALLIILLTGAGCMSVTAKAPDIDAPILLGRALQVTPDGIREMDSRRVGKFDWLIERKESTSECLLSRDSSVSSNSKRNINQLNRAQAAPADDSGTIILYRLEELKVQARFGILPLIIYNTSTDVTRMDLKGTIRAARSRK